MGKEVTKTKTTALVAAAGKDEIQALRKARDAQIARQTKLALQVALDFTGEDNPPNTIDRDAKERGSLALALAGHIPNGSPLFRTMLASELTGLKESSGIIGTMYAIEPRDGVEQVLASQMAKVQSVIQRMYRGFESATDLERMRFYEGAINRLSRTFTSQVEAMRKHRTGGTQTVRHVHVNEGGQAIVADTVSTTHVSQGEGENET